MPKNCKSNGLTPFDQIIAIQCKSIVKLQVKNYKLKKGWKVLHSLSQLLQVWFSREIYTSQVEKKFLREKVTTKDNHKKINPGFSRGEKQIYFRISPKSYIKSYYLTMDEEQRLLLEAFLNVYALSLSIA